MKPIKKDIRNAAARLPIMLMAVGSLWLLQSALAYTSGHGVIIRNTVYDAGTLKTGSVINHGVHVLNLSGQTVEVDARPSCGCTVVDTPGQPLAPLHTETIMVQVNTDGMKPGADQKVVVMHLQSGQSVWQLPAIIKFNIKG